MEELELPMGQLGHVILLIKTVVEVVQAMELILVLPNLKFKPPLKCTLHPIPRALMVTLNKVTIQVVEQQVELGLLNNSHIIQ